MTGSARALAVAALLASNGALAQGAAARVGIDLGLLMREEAGGQRSPLPALNARAQYELTPWLSAGLVYTLGIGWEGTLVRGFTHHHRVTLRPELRWSLGTAALVLGAGPTLAYTRTSISDPDTTISTGYSRVMATGGVGFEVRLGDTRLRAATDLAWGGALGWPAGRLDVLLWLGGSFGIGGAR